MRTHSPSLGALRDLSALWFHANTSKVAISKYRKNAFANFICSGVLQSASKRVGDATTMHAHCARDVATL